MKSENLGIRWKCTQCGARFWDRVSLDKLHHMRKAGRIEAYRRSCVTCGRERSMRVDVIGQWDLFHPPYGRDDDTKRTSNGGLHGRAK